MSPLTLLMNYSTVEAILLCQMNGMVLGSLETQEEDHAVRGWLVDQGWSFIEGRGFRASGRQVGNLWMWTSTGQPFNYTAWSSTYNEPNDNYSDSFMDIQGAEGWFDNPVDYKMMYSTDEVILLCQSNGMVLGSLETQARKTLLFVGGSMTK
ncbi:hypothetical protein B566_EDAN014015, partial [Ephemera danica]